MHIVYSCKPERETGGECRRRKQYHGRGGGDEWSGPQYNRWFMYFRSDRTYRLWPATIARRVKHLRRRRPFSFHPSPGREVDATTPAGQRSKGARTGDLRLGVAGGWLGVGADRPTTRVPAGWLRANCSDTPRYRNDSSNNGNNSRGPRD